MNRSLFVASSVRALARARLRTAFMSFGVVLGVATLIVARSLGTGAEQVMLEKVRRMFGPDSLMIQARNPSPGAGRVNTFKIADLEALEQQIAEIVAWDPMVVAGGRDVSHGDEHRQVTVFGHSEKAEDVWNRSVVEGTFFTREDFVSKSRVALLGPRIAQDLFAEHSPLGEQILIDSVPFRVAGVLEPIGFDPHGMDRDEDVYIPTSTMMRRVLNTDSLTGAKLLVNNPQQVEEVASRIEEVLRDRHGIADGETADFAVFTPVFVNRMIRRANRVLKVFLPAAAGVLLLVATLVIASILWVAVQERTVEIGLRRAVGATEAQVSRQFLLEATALTAASGAAGLGVAVTVLAAISSAMRVPLHVAPDAVILGLGAALAVGVLAGVLPARQAARLDPVLALKT